MGGSTIKLQKMLNIVAAKGIPTPLMTAGGYAQELALQVASDTMSDLIAERFNWKWNRRIAAPFYTNSYQQDYPQLELVDLGWLEQCWVVDINNTSMPKPRGQATCRRDLPALGQFIGSGPGGVDYQSLSWDYNKNLQFGVWPGRGVVYSPLVTAQVVQNPIMSMIDANRNLLIVSSFGTTGSTAPQAQATAPEGTTVIDGTMTWVVVGRDSQGFRVGPLPGPTGPVYQFTPIYQMLAKNFAALDETLDPIPDDYASTFLSGLEYQCKGASANPNDKKEFREDYPMWLNALEKARKQGDREADAYGMLPATSPVENIWGTLRNPQDPSQPY